MSGAPERARAFLEEHGDEFARRRAAVLAGEQPLDHVAGALETPTDVPGALTLLGVVSDLRGLYAPVAERTVAFLERAQHQDGSWGGIFETGMLAGYLGRTPRARPATLAAAGVWLAAAWAPERVKGGAWKAIAAFAHFFANVPHELSDAALQWCGRELERGFRAGVFDAVQTARVLLWCDAAAIPGAQLASGELREAILAAQDPDGGWTPARDPSPPARIAHTLDAVTALVRWRRGRT